MKRLRFHSDIIRRAALSLGLVTFFSTFISNAQAAISFLGVASGDATATSAIVWTRAVDADAPANTPLTLEYGTAPLPAGSLSAAAAAAAGVTQRSGACTTDSTKDYTCKAKIEGLTPNTVYYYRFVAANQMSITGRFKTAPDASTSAPVHFAFSGDNDGLIRPYALASVVPSQNLDFYITLGDIIYETASNLKARSEDDTS